MRACLVARARLLPILAALAAAAAAGEWAPPRLAVPGRENVAAAVAAAGARVVVTWAARSASETDVYTAFSSDGGLSFGAPVRVNDVPGDARVSGEQAPRVAVARDVRVVWVSRAAGASVVRTATSTAGANTFSSASVVHAEGLAGARGWASLALGGDGAAHVAWLDGRVSASAGAAAGGHGASGHGAHSGMRQDLFHAVCPPDGPCREAAVATDVCFCCKTSVAAAPDGSLYVAWRHIYPPNLRDIAVARSTDGWRTFSAPVRVSEDHWAIDACPDDGPSIAVDARGVLHVAWPTLVPEVEGKGIFYSSSSDGGRTFAPRERLDTGRGASHPQVAASGGRLAVAWDQKDGDAPRVVRLREQDLAAAGGPRWAPAVVLSDGAAAAYPAVAGVPGGFVAAWSEADGPASVIRVRRLER